MHCMQARLVDPVIAADGHTYERQAMMSYLQQHNRSPVSQKPLASKDVTPNYAIRKLLIDQGWLHI